MCDLFNIHFTMNNSHNASKNCPNLRFSRLYVPGVTCTLIYFLFICLDVQVENGFIFNDCLNNFLSAFGHWCYLCWHYKTQRKTPHLLLCIFSLEFSIYFVTKKNHWCWKSEIRKHLWKRNNVKVSGQRLCQTKVVS